MKQLLSGNDWKVSHFQPDEVSPCRGHIARMANGPLYGGSFISATVPGDVQTDAFEAGLIEDINYHYNARSAEWTYQRDWLYVKRFMPQGTASEYERVYLCFDGVDDLCEIFLNGKWLGNHEIPWMPFRFDVTDQVKYGEENILFVLVKAAREAECQWGRTTAVKHLKARFAYGWDWCTRLVPLGIWQDVYLRYDKQAAIEDLYVYAEVAPELDRAVLRAEITVSGDLTGVPMQAWVTHPCGKTEALQLEELIQGDQGKTDVTAALYGTAQKEPCTTIHRSLVVKNPQLWYPNGMGDQPLYEVTVTIGSGNAAMDKEMTWDKRSVRTGIRHITWTRTEGAGEDALLYQPYINGRRVYLQGYNFTPIRQLYGREHREVYHKRLKLVQKVGANYLRVWGGGLLEREVFYDYCDEMGILVMQELFQSSASVNNHPPRTPEYIDMIVKATESAVVQKRNHAALISWCGGNELCYRGEYMDAKGNILIEGAEGNEGYTYDISGYGWIPLHQSYPTLAAMEKAVRGLDQKRMWFHTSGSGPITQGANPVFAGGNMHDVHGPWKVFAPEEFYGWYNALDMMVHHEFGCPASASVQTLETVVDKKFRWPIDGENPMLNFRGRMYIAAPETLKLFFGELQDHRTFALASRFVQWEQLRYALEAHRRLGKVCACSCLWHMAEPWPNMLDNCMIDAFEQVKPAYYGQKAAFRPLHIAPKLDGIIHTEREFTVEMTLYNSTDKAFHGSIQTKLYSLDGKLLQEYRNACGASADTTVPAICTLRFDKLADGPMFLCYMLFDEEDRELERGYSIHTLNRVPYQALLNQPECKIETKLLGNTLYLTNTGSAVVSGLTVECDNNNTIYFSDGCMLILPGETRTVTLEYSGEQCGNLYISGFGVPYQKLNC